LVTAPQQLLLDWITDSSGDSSDPVAIHLLLVQRAMHSRGESADLTASTKLSLELFERTAVYRDLRELYTKGLIEFVGTNGLSYVPTEKEISSAGAGENVSFRAVRLAKG
jgi:hypothetical protein